MEISEIKTEIEQLQNDLNAENQRGALKDGTKVAELEKRIAELTQDMETEQREQQYAQRTEEVAEEISTAIEEFSVGGLDMRSFCLNEPAYQTLRIFFHDLLQGQAQKLLEENKSIREETDRTIADLRRETSRLNRENEEQAEQITSTRQELYQVTEENKDLSAKREAAQLEIDELQAEIDRLNSQVQDLRTEIAVGAKSATKVLGTNISGDMAAAVEAFKASRPAIYDIKPLDLRRSRFTAKLAATDEEITFSYLESGKYREVTPEEAETFRAEYLAAQEQQVSDEDHTHDIPEEVTYTVPYFREDEGAAGGLDQTDAGGEVAGKTVEERIQALELAVFGPVKVEAA